MRMRWCVLLLVPLVGCVSQKAFDSKSLEARNLKQQYEEQAEQTKALEQTSPRPRPPPKRRRKSGRSWSPRSPRAMRSAARCASEWTN